MSMLLRSFNLFTTYFPRVFLTILLLWSYWALIFKVILILPIFFGIKGIILILILTYLFLISIISYFKVILIGPGSPIDFPILIVNNYNEDENGNLIINEDLRLNIKPPERFILNSIMIKRDGRFRFCSKCKCWKPDRSHHCSTCGTCILKMDHHCPWFSKCIGFKNHRYFIQFLINIEIYLIFITILSGWVLNQFFIKNRYPLKKFSFHILFIFCLGIVFTICVTIFSSFTIYQLLKNKTTIENYEFQRYRRRHTNNNIGNVFDLGIRYNWKMVMGDRWWQWMLPVDYVYDAGPQCEDAELYADGVCFPVKDEVASGFRLVERLARVSADLERGRN